MHCDQISAEIILRVFIRGSHQFRKFGIRTGKKRGGCVKFDNLALAHYENAITCDDRLQSVSDRKYSAIRELVLQRVLHCRFSFRINGGSGFV